MGRIEPTHASAAEVEYLAIRERARRTRRKVGKAQEAAGMTVDGLRPWRQRELLIQ